MKTNEKNEAPDNLSNSEDSETNESVSCSDQEDNVSDEYK